MFKKIITFVLFAVFTFGFVSPALAGGGDDCPVAKKKATTVVKKRTCVTCPKADGVARADNKRQDEELAALRDGKADKADLAGKANQADHENLEKRVTVIENKLPSFFVLPDLGGLGWLIFWIGIMALIAAAIYALVRGRGNGGGTVYNYPANPPAPQPVPVAYNPGYQYHPYGYPAPAPQPAPAPAAQQNQNGVFVPVNYEVAPITIRLGATVVPQQGPANPPAAQ
ncbi:hypothetical protein IPM19_01345 [bacterium]|nr:MAG: hypothetical protein IPM19_01345 [bacterium]